MALPIVRLHFFQNYFWQTYIPLNFKGFLASYTPWHMFSFFVPFFGVMPIYCYSPESKCSCCFSGLLSTKLNKKFHTMWTCKNCPLTLKLGEKGISLLHFVVINAWKFIIIFGPKLKNSNFILMTTNVIRRFSTMECLKKWISILMLPKRFLSNNNYLSFYEKKRQMTQISGTLV